MAVFISHSQADRPMFTTLVAALKGQNVSVWEPKSMYAGKSLKDQLKEAIKTCDVCVFLATQNSLKSDWCRAEIGAFWGAGKEVVVFIYDPKISGGEVPLPPELTGDLYTTAFEDVVRAAQNTIRAAEDRRRQEAARRPRLVSEMTIAALYDTLASLRSTSLDSLPAGEAIRLIRDNVFHRLVDIATMKPLVSRLVGVPQEIVEETAGTYWPVSFTLLTDTGVWTGFARELKSSKLINEYSNCFLLLWSNGSCIASAAAGTVVEREAQVFCDDVVEYSTTIGLGSPKYLSAKGNA